MASPLIFGCASLSLTPEEKEFFRETRPWGVIIFSRNIDTPAQLCRLTDEIKEAAGAEAHILIDQEGGRVSRLKEPHFRHPPSQGSFGEMPLPQAKEACYQNARQMAEELLALGIDVDCAPMLDVRFPFSNEAVIGDRAFSADPETVAALGAEMARGLMDGGVLPVIKHIPGHGRATLDSHDALPVVTASREELEADFLPFKRLAHLPLAMTAHITYTALDSLPATLSPRVIKLIREEIGFKGLIMTDDLSMKALSGNLAELTRASFAAGCDLVLHCNGKMEEMREIGEATCALI